MRDSLTDKMDGQDDTDNYGDSAGLDTEGSISNDSGE